MPGRIEIHDEAAVLAGLMRVPGASRGDDARFGLGDRGDVKVEVRLLRDVTVRPLGRPVLLYPLAGDVVAEVSRRRARVDPLRIGLGGVHFPAEQRGVELGERHGIGAVEGEYGVLGLNGTAHTKAV